LQNRT